MKNGASLAAATYNTEKEKNTNYGWRTNNWNKERKKNKKQTLN